MRRIFSALVVGTVAIALYSATAAPSILTFFDDSLEFQLIAPSLGIAHPTGYPLYTLLGALWSRVLFPVGNWAWRMNMLSAISAGLAVAVVFDLGQRLLPQALHTSVEHRRGLGLQQLIRLMPSVVAASCFGLTPAWWQQATVAEVYALHGLFVALILRLTVAVGDSLQHSLMQAEASSKDVRSIRRWVIFRPSCTWLALLIGLSLAHHRTTLLLIPGVLLYLLLVAPTLFRPQVAWMRWAIALVSPLGLYLYIPIRSLMGAVDLNGSYQNSTTGFFAHINASAYSTFLAWNEQAWPIFVQQFSWWGILWGALGSLTILFVLPKFVALGLRRSVWREWILLWATFITSMLFGLYYSVDDVAVFMIPAYLCWSLWAGAGFWSFWQYTSVSNTAVLSGTALSGTTAQIQSQGDRSAAVLNQVPTWGSFVGYCLVAFFIGVSPLLYNSTVNKSQEWAAHDKAIAMAKVAFPPDSVFVGLEGEATAVKYMQEAEGLAPNVTALWANEPDLRSQLVNGLTGSKQPLYLTRELAGIEDKYSFTSEGPLIRVWPRGQVESREPRNQIDLPLVEGALTLRGIDVDILQEAGGPSLQLTYFWLPNEKLAHRIKLSMRLQNGDVVLKDHLDAPMVIDEFPLRQVSYSTDWLPEETIWDTHKLLLPRIGAGYENHAFSTTELNLNTIIYDADSLQELGRIEVPLPSWLD